MMEPVQVPKQKLLQQIAAQRQEINILHDRVGHLEQHQHDYQQTVLFVNRYWDQLNDDVQYMLLQANSTALPALSAPAVEDDTADQLANIQDPILRRLLSSSDAATSKAAQDGQRSLTQIMSDVEQQLSDRLDVTKGMLAKLIDVQRQVAGQQHDQGQGAGTSALQASLDSLRALQRTAQEQLRQADDRVLELQQKVRDLTTQLAEREQQVLNLVKKLDSGAADGDPGAAAAAALGIRGSQPGSSNLAAAAAAAAATDEAMALLQKDLQAAREQLAQARALLDSEREAHLRCQRELQQALARPPGDAQVLASPLHQSRLLEIEALHGQLARRAAELEALMRERDAAAEEAAGRRQLEAAERRLATQLQASQKQVAQMAAAKADLERQRGELELALQAEKAAVPRPQTLAELRSMLTALQQEVAAHKAKQQSGRGAVDKLAAAAKQVQEAHVKLETKSAEVRRLVERLRAKSSQLAEASKAADAQREAAEDLHAFVAVLTTFCDDPRELAAVRASEEALRRQVQALRTELEGGDAQTKVSSLQQQLQQAEAKLEASQAAADELALQLAGAQAHVSELQAQVTSLQADVAAYASEIESSTTAFEEMQALNSSLLRSAVERDEAHAALAAEKARMAQEKLVVANQLQDARQEVVRLQDEARAAAQVQQAAAADVAKLRADLAAAHEQARLHYSRAEALAQQLQGRAEQAAALEAQLVAAHGEAEARKRQSDEEADRHQRECVKRQRLEEEHAALGARVEQLRRMAIQTSAVQELELEIAAFRKILNCSVCGERRKNTVITKCGHAFCAECVKKNVESRNRKCPGCGHQFGANDHRPLFLT